MEINPQQLLADWGQPAFYVVLIGVAGFFARRWVLRIESAISSLTETVKKLDKNQALIHQAMRFRGVMPADSMDEIFIDGH